jgi:hypothetical protein
MSLASFRPPFLKGGAVWARSPRNGVSFCELFLCASFLQRKSGVTLECCLTNCILKEGYS